MKVLRFYQVFIRFLSGFYQVFIRFLLGFYQVFIRFLSGFIRFYHFLSGFQVFRFSGFIARTRFYLPFKFSVFFFFFFFCTFVG